MGILRRYFQRRREIERRLKEIESERRELVGACVPYKIESWETPYFRREEYLRSVKRLEEIDRERDRIGRESMVRTLYNLMFV